MGRIDEKPGDPWDIPRVVVDALGAAMLVTIILDLWRIFLGPIYLSFQVEPLINEDVGICSYYTVFHFRFSIGPPLPLDVKSAMSLKMKNILKDG
ncbi:cyclopropyl isomerase [Thalictrum thalictroides]|uniref:Cyclopropyl isomerase n=1 Tax=Thalictrum thalictroides TaxID=46969 RepID=A0A7J6WWN5_THATH|nr:cyclopropyl isomerase [Thalictrum thalictroides]